MDCSPSITLCFRLGLAAAAFAGGAIAGPAAADIRVVASIKPVHSLVSAVMAGVGKPHLLMRGKASPHTFTMRPSDAAALQEANVVFLIDEAMETTLARAIDALAGKARVVALADAKGLIRRPLREGGAFEADPEHDQDKGDKDHAREEAGGHHDHGEFDMHVWLDPVNAWTMGRAIADTLSQADPTNAAKYKANARALLPRLDALTAQISAAVAPVRGKPFVVFHDGYRYFEDRFGLNAVGSMVVSPGRSPVAGRQAPSATARQDTRARCRLRVRRTPIRQAHRQRRRRRHEGETGDRGSAGRRHKGRTRAVFHPAPQHGGGVHGLSVARGLGRKTGPVPLPRPKRVSTSPAAAFHIA